MNPIVAIVGRTNVGKSKLFNYLIGKRLSIVEDRKGVTRDRIIAKTTWNGRDFDLVDTAGIEEEKGKNEIEVQMQIQTDFAIQMADVVLFLTDVKTGVCPEDIEIFKKLRKYNKKVVLAVNKCDKLGELPPDFYDFYSLGNPIPISAANATGLGDMLDEIVALLPERDNDEENEPINVALIGKPNVGKSSIINKIVGQNRNIVSDIPGTTTDAVDTPLENKYGKYVFIDTAGIRRKAKVNERIEKFSVLRSELAVERADVCILVISAEEGITVQDTKILGIAHDMGKAIIIVVNKWDAIEKDNKTHNEYVKSIRLMTKYAQYAPIITTSAVTGQKLNDLFPLINRVYENNRRELKTSDVNKIIEQSVAFNQPPSDKGRKLKIYYGTQTGVCPPTFTLYVNDKELFHFSYQRYIINNIRKAADFEGTKIKIDIKERNEKF